MASLATHPFCHGLSQPFLAMPPTLSSLPFPQLHHQHCTASLRSSPSQRSCELCTQPAALRCDADSAFLCATCDAAVHSANFIVLRHSRHLLCALCSSPTSWEAPLPFHQPAAAAQTQVLCDSCLAVGAVSGITGNAVFHTPCAMSASMAASLLPLHTYAAALSSSAFVPSPPLNVAPKSQSLAKRHKANIEDLLAFSQLALRGPHVSDLAFHIFQKVLRKLQPGRVAADSLRVTLAACMWTAAKLDDNQKTLPRASDVAAVARVPAKRLQAAELEVMKLVDWRPLEGFTGFQE
ncbi:unnamed protein product [Closterium sp. NIES-65]|nr:unnamed protein product [Closterium sp. NIES-65]